MARPFRTSRGRLELRLESAEAQLLEQLCGDLLERLGEVDDRSTLDGDPVLGRLFPDGYRDDPAAADELRSLIQSDLREAKVSSATTVLATLAGLPDNGRASLSPEQAAAWLATLNDLRLALGTLLDITDDDDPRFDRSGQGDADPSGQGDPDAADDYDEVAMSVYLFLGWLQSNLVDALD
jgi:hypothetical protein